MAHNQKAAKIAGMLSITVEINKKALEKRYAQGWIDEIISSPDKLVKRIRESQSRNKVFSNWIFRKYYRSMEKIIQRKYYRTKTLQKLRNKVRNLEATLQMFRDSPEGVQYFERKTKEYQKAVQRKECRKNKGVSKKLCNALKKYLKETTVRMVN